MQDHLIVHARDHVFGFTNPNWQFSPDDKDILIKDTNLYYLIQSASVTTSISNSAINSKLAQSYSDSWKKEKNKRLDAQLKKAPEEIQTIILNKTKSPSFSGNLLQ